MPTTMGMEGVLGVLAVLGVVLVIGLGVYGNRRTNARSLSLRDWAGGRGWQYIPVRDELAGVLPGVAFDRGEPRRCRNLVRGTLGGLPMTAFDYSFVVPTRSLPSAAATDGGDRVPTGTTTFQLKVLLLELPETWPRVSAAPKDLVGALGVTLPGQSVAVGHPELDSRLQITTDDEEAALRLLRPLGDALLAHPDQAVEVQHNALLLYRPGVHESSELAAWLDGLAAPVAAATSGAPGT